MKKILKIFPLIWLLLGSIILGMTIYGYWLLQRTDMKGKEIYYLIQDKQDIEIKQKEISEEAIFDPNNIHPVDTKEFAIAQLHYEELVDEWGIGKIFLPSASIQTTILAGMNNDHLMVGVGTYLKEQRLGKGNYVLLAHNLVQGGGTLKNLPQTKNHTLIYATDFSNVYEYRVTKNQIIHQFESEVLDHPKEKQKPVLTLIRCEGGLNTENRAVVQGEYVREYPEEEANDKLKGKLGLVSLAKKTNQATKDIGVLEESGQQRKGNAINTSPHLVREVQTEGLEKIGLPVYSSVEKLGIWLVQQFSDFDTLLYYSCLYLLVLILLM